MSLPLLLLHGALGSKDQFGPLVQQLASHRPVFSFNFSGHGGTPMPGTFSMQGFTNEILAFLEQQQVAEVQIFGYSMGGYAALQLASQDPSRIRSITTLGTKFHWTPESAAKEIRFLDPEVVRQKVPAFSRALEARHAPQDWQAVMRKTAEMMTALGNGAALTPEDFARINIPVSLFLGSEDHMVSREETEQVAGWLPQGSYEILEGVPHPLEKVDPKILLTLIQA